MIKMNLLLVLAQFVCLSLQLGLVKSFVLLGESSSGRTQSFVLTEKGASSSNEEPVDPYKYYTNTTIAESSAYRDMQQDAAVVKRKKRGNSYKIMDNRDNLPFVVQLKTPDPYTHPEVKKERARKNTERDRKTNKRLVPTNLKVGGVAASIYQVGDGGDDEERKLLPILGEFQLDKSTTCGDIILVGDRAFQVQTARCQYKYAGGQRFEMVRKILEVKPVQRVAEEAVLQRSLRNSVSEEAPPELE
jgi:hypothetical protein